MNAFILSFHLFLLIWMGAIFWTVPRFSRREIFFAVTVSPDFRDTVEAETIQRGYRRFILAATIVALAIAGLPPLLVQLIGTVNMTATILASTFAGILVLLTACLAAFLQGRRRTLPHQGEASTVREASLTLKEGPVAPLAWALLLLLAFTIVAGLAVLAFNWEAIPDRYPTHWNMAGEVDGWTNKTAGGVFFLFFLLPPILIPLFAIWYGTRGARLSKRKNVTVEQENRYRQALDVMFAFIALLEGLMLVVTGVWLPLRTPDTAMPLGLLGLVFGLNFLLLIGLSVFFYRMSKSMAPASTPGDEALGDGTPDSCWKWGLFYYNPDDPAIWVEKRFGIGWTCNFARAGSWWLMGALLLFPALLIGLIVLLPKIV